MTVVTLFLYFLHVFQLLKSKQYFFILGTQLIAQSQIQGQQQIPISQQLVLLQSDVQPHQHIVTPPYVVERNSSTPHTPSDSNKYTPP